LLLIFIGFGPGFYVATRFDLSGWVARTVLESALVAPVVVICLWAGFGLEWARRRKESAGLLLAAAAVGGSLWQNSATASHRDDFSAYDYIKDLRRALPPGSTAAAGGDTALYASRYFDLAHPDGQRRKLVDFQDVSRSAPAAMKSVRPDYVLGLSLQNLARLGLGPEMLSPAGLVQCVTPSGSRGQSSIGGDASRGAVPFLAADTAWEFSILRRGLALRSEESYARDILFSYAFAHYFNGTLREARRGNRGGRDFVLAAVFDLEDYQIEYNGAGARGSAQKDR
jgi:hypothetical protein